jgi:hypothetical protein
MTDTTSVTWKLHQKITMDVRIITTLYVSSGNETNELTLSVLHKRWRTIGQQQLMLVVLT